MNGHTNGAATNGYLNGAVNNGNNNGAGNMNGNGNLNGGAANRNSGPDETAAGRFPFDEELRVELRGIYVGAGANEIKGDPKSEWSIRWVFDALELKISALPRFEGMQCTVKQIFYEVCSAAHGHRYPRRVCYEESNRGPINHPEEYAAVTETAEGRALRSRRATQNGNGIV